MRSSTAGLIRLRIASTQHCRALGMGALRIRIAVSDERAAFDQSYLESLDRLGEPIEIQERRNATRGGANLSPNQSTPPIGRSPDPAREWIVQA